jgi:transposase InsO family protein
MPGMKNSSTPLAFDDPAIEIALFRHGLIASLIHHPPDSGRLEAELRVLAAKTYLIPHSRRTRVSLATLRRYLQAYRAHGFEALLPKTRRDQGQPQAFAPAVLHQAIALREQQPGRTTPMLVEILKRDGISVNAHTLDTHLRQAGKTRRLLRPAPAPSTRFEREHVNALWQSDASHGPWLPDPARPGQLRRTHLIAFLDDHSRLIPYGEFFFEEALPRLERVLKVALLRRGVPDAVYVDNGQIFNATQFRAACATLRIEVIFASPYHPQGKGKIEQFWHRVQESFYPEVAASQITDLATLNHSFWAWLHGVYHARVHGETGQSPLDRFLAGAEQLRAADPETLRLAFQWRTKRTVTRQATLSLQGNVYHVDPAWGGQVIELRYDPFDLTHMEVYRAGVRLGTAHLTAAKRQRHLAVERLVPDPPPTTAPAQIDFLQTLREEHEQALRRQVGGIHFSQLDTPTTTD